ncbi:ABC transporter ATP-binding protein [Ulvibacter litoralis]|uniref:ABC-type multidrug transport system, ATPase and permease component n=1 Tax=Ulvibacter litoralis TaxID=227084 RepID=A0A1G7H119_9FLAO|nr:ABC transporter ATP-binding protein [Ulvibacter litoralis]GHC59317.1 ABC transporter ATP-binding protein [Ulvibacter litoralis]SDE94024.1 ABC-type multidrug transport system, ATPase and permease component [Ulvibacter litoralis]
MKDSSKLSLLALFKKLFVYIKPYKHLVIATLLLTVIGSFLAQVNALVLRYAVDELTVLSEANKTVKDGLSLLTTISVILLLKEGVYALVQFGQKFYGEKMKIYISRDFAQNIVEKILTYRMAFYSSPANESGKLQTRIDLGVTSLTQLVKNFFIDILPLFFNAFIALFLMFKANVYIGFVSLAILPIFFYISSLQATKLKGFRRKMRGFRESRNNGIISLINSITVIKSFTRENLESKKHETIQLEMTENQLKTRQLSFLFDGVKTFVEQFGVVIIIILTAYFVLNGSMTIGAIMFHILLFNNVSAPIRQLHRIYDEVNDAMIYSESFFEIMDAHEETEIGGSYIPEKISGVFEIKNIDFAYPNGTKALFDVSMVIKPNTINALVGLSGAGKSTVINLLDKFYAPSSGKIFLDGVDLQEYNTQWLRDNIGLVLQKNHIFNGSIEENILYGKVDATHEEVVDAAKQAYIHEQIIELPEGYNSKATLLSGGQQQRVSIARLFLKNPPIIFLDEPAASLDAVATEKIKKSLDAIKKGRTVIIISHSISQIIDAENVIVMGKGKVVEQGTHEKLYKNKSAYYEIFNAMANSLNIDKITNTIEK